MSKYDDLQGYLLHHQFKWLITGVAGFIGSNLLETLLNLNQIVIGIDNFVTGYRRNIDEVLVGLSSQQRKKFDFYEGDICVSADCENVIQGVDYVLHQAALGSVLRSIENPLTTHATNVTGFLNVLEAAKNHRVKRFVYASSSSVYGDLPDLPKNESKVGNQLSPYAVTKYVDELYAGVFAKCYGVETIGLRYFNVFGARQDPNGVYAAVIPLWIKALLTKDSVFINGDGNTTRDFCYIKNVVQANLLAALIDDHEALNEVYNIAVGERITLNKLLQNIQSVLEMKKSEPCYLDFRAGDIRYSLADISKAKKKLGYAPQYRVLDGLKEAIDWYKNFFIGAAID